VIPATSYLMDMAAFYRAAAVTATEPRAAAYLERVAAAVEGLAKVPLASRPAAVPAVASPDSRVETSPKGRQKGPDPSSSGYTKPAATS
jgi:hypothetical protein